MTDTEQAADSGQSDDDSSAPTGSVADIVAWVAGDAGRANEALALEETRSRPRTGLVTQLQAIAGGAEATVELDVLRPGPCPAEGLVLARWVSTQDIVAGNGQGLIRYGDPIWVGAEQIEASPDLVEFVDDWTPDAALAAVSRKEG
jgi:hypothetical protein